MKGFKQFKKIIENKNISKKNFDDFITSHINAKKLQQMPLETLQNVEEMIDRKLTSLPFELEEILFRESKVREEKNKNDKDDNDKDDDDHDDQAGMKFPIPRLGVKY